MTRRVVVVLTALTVIGGPGTPRAIHAGQERSPQSYSTATTAILVDVVVRDRKGRPVTDLTVADFELYEDRVAQKIDTFSRVTRGGGIGVDVKWKRPGSTVAILAPGSLPPPLPGEDAANQGTTALVFDHLSEEALGLAQKATLEYVPMTGESDVQVGVFATDPGIRVMHGYTTDRSAIRRAVSQIMPAGSSAADQKAARRDEIMERRRELQGEQLTLAAATAAGGAGGTLAASGSQMGQSEIELRLLEMERAMIDGFDTLDRDHKGYDTTLALVRVIRSLAENPGRKSIVLFSEGLPVSPVLSARFEDLIDVANRSNVTVYAVDAKGLRTSTSSADTRKQLQEFTDDRMMQNISGGSGGDQPLTRGLERVEDMVRLDSRTGLARLSQDTGGFLVEQSNNLTKAFKRIDEDNQFHYLLTYTPTNTVFDGKFRTILVKAERPGVDVFARKGYRAVRGHVPIDSGGFEVPALAMLNRTPLPNAFPIRAQGFSFPDPSRPGMTPILVRFTTDVLQYSIDADRGTYSAQVAVVARLRDAQAREVQKLSQQYTLSGEMKDLEAAKKGTILFYREPALPPGVYTLETVVLDVVSGRGSARVSTITVDPAAPTALGMSSLVLVDHLEQVENAPTQSSDRTAPFYVKNTLVYPNIGDPVARGAQSDLPFFFTVYRGSKARLTATAELMKNGQVMASVPIELVDGDGPRLQEIARLPVGALAPGTYELRIRVASADEEVVRSAFFTLEN
jgi:VWFA-related protein